MKNSIKETQFYKDFTKKAYPFFNDLLENKGKEIAFEFLTEVFIEEIKNDEDIVQKLIPEAINLWLKQSGIDKDILECEKKYGKIDVDSLYNLMKYILGDDKNE